MLIDSGTIGLGLAALLEEVGPPEPRRCGTWRVVHSKGVFVREMPSVSAEPAGAMKHGAEFEAWSGDHPGWVRVVERVDRGVTRGWVLKHGAVLGLGPLIEEVATAAQEQEAAPGEASSLPMTAAQAERSGGAHAPPPAVLALAALACVVLTVELVRAYAPLAYHSAAAAPSPEKHDEL